ncbi:hypothetical protein L2E82_20209 [Cichorium intybus]|uniref:Uncharacterized protein n=1 Tax=Cichorium intybus TaxID=13427 RepID=A0ACB9DSP1_CICIN|nr:hypothetical protein L2E82_20209 [Cichorium intybus]
MKRIHPSRYQLDNYFATGGQTDKFSIKSQNQASLGRRLTSESALSPRVATRLETFNSPIYYSNSRFTSAELETPVPSSSLQSVLNDSGNYEDFSSIYSSQIFTLLPSSSTS